MKRALVTSATSSIGRVIAKDLAQAGYELTLHYHTNHELAQELAAELGATITSVDLSNKDHVQAFLGELKAADNFDVIVNNAGISASDRQGNLDFWENVFLINATVPALLLSNATELLNDNSVVINISSAYGHERFGEPDYIAYSASKAALNSITRTFAKKLAPRTRVNAIAPGYVRSTWNENFTADEIDDLIGEQLTTSLVEPQHIADLIKHIITNTALTGEVIYLDGGLTLKTI